LLHQVGTSSHFQLQILRSIVVPAQLDQEV